MINIIISASQQNWNKCAISSCTEQDHTHIIAKYISELLQGYECNVCLIPKVYGTENETLQKVVNYSNAFVDNNSANISYHLDIHTDAGGGQGATGFYLSEGGKAFIQRVYNAVSLITPWEDNGILQKNFYVLRETKAIAGLIEVAFHDAYKSAKWIHDNVVQIAQAIVSGIVTATGIKKKDVDYVAVVNTLAKAGILGNKELWTQYVIKDANVKALMFNMAGYINSHK